MRLVSLHSAERVVSVLVVAAFYCLIPDPRVWLALVISTGLGHYILSIIYSRKQIAQVTSQPLPMVLFAGLLVSGVALYWVRFPLIILFGIHHVFNEVYLLRRSLKLRDGPDTTALRTGSIVVNLFLYFATVRHYPEVHFINHTFLFVGGLVACLAFLVLLLRAGRAFTATQLVDCCVFEVVGLVLLGVSFYHRIDVYHVVLYHCVFWGIYPLQKLAQQGAGEVRSYIALNVAAICAGFLISPLSILHPLRLTDGHWDSLFRLTSILHIMMAFGLSTAHPAWITRWFQLRSSEALSKPA